MANGFDFHNEVEHNMWHYVFFLVHLDEKDKTDYSGTESYIADKYEMQDISWFPMNKAISMIKPKSEQDKANKGEDDIVTKIEEIEVMME